MEPVRFEDWEAEQMKDWRFRLLCKVTWPFHHRWARFRMWLWKRMHGARHRPAEQA